jgi:prepilin-type N-terminal cleavage/methylation domain-containing protein
MQQMNRKNIRQRRKNKQGFTLIELLMSVLIFSIVMVVVVSVFVKSLETQKRIRGSQRNLEDAKFALETMAKTLRSSELISCNRDVANSCSSGITSLETFDYSQNKCIQYKFENNKVRAKSNTVTGPGECNFASGSVEDISGNNNRIENMNFLVTKKSDTQVGKITITMEICSTVAGVCSAGKSDRFPVQTTVSLRN